MNMPFKPERQATQLAQAEAIATAAVAYVHGLRASGGQHTYRVMLDMLALMEAVIDHVDDGDCLAQAESLREELRIDPDPLQDQFVERLSPAVFGPAR